MTPERLKEIREILDQEIYITNHRVHFALKAADELYDEVSSRMPVSVEERRPEIPAGRSGVVLALVTAETSEPFWCPMECVYYEGVWGWAFDARLQTPLHGFEPTHWMPMPATGGPSE
jgi:hypothetical protein